MRICKLCHKPTTDRRGIHAACKRVVDRHERKRLQTLRDMGWIKPEMKPIRK